MSQLSKLPKKIVVLGNSCAGKTTFAARLASQLGSIHVELDSLFWEPNWQEAQTEVFRNRVTDALNTESWIVDGNYKSKIKDLVWPKADAFVWLDPSLSVVLSRFFYRSFKRTFKREILWGGCRESLRNSIFQRNSLLIWILTTHTKKSGDYLKLVDNPPSGKSVYRLRNSIEVESFFRNLEKHD
jgi:adenylate kinase family enzyme